MLRRFLCWLHGPFRHRLTETTVSEDHTHITGFKHTVGRTCRCGHRQVIILVTGEQRQIHP
jgi:hypothetical protein